MLTLILLPSAMWLFGFLSPPTPPFFFFSEHSKEGDFFFPDGYF